MIQSVTSSTVFYLCQFIETMSSFSLLRSFSSDTQSTTTPVKQTQQQLPRRPPLKKRFSFHQKQHQIVKDPIEIGPPTGRNKKSKALTRRWSSLKQYQTTTLSQQSLATGSSASGAVNSPSSANASSMYQANSTCDNQRTLHGSNGSSDVKKKWEVIEHYKENIKGRETISSSLLAVSFVVVIKCYHGRKMMLSNNKSKKALLYRLDGFRVKKKAESAFFSSIRWEWKICE